MATRPLPAAPPANAPPPPPVISPDYIDTPMQRLYALGMAGVLQAFKFSEAMHSSPSTWQMFKWFCFDALYITLLPKLRIPRLTFSWNRTVVLLLLCASWNWVLFGNYSVALPFSSILPSLGSSGDHEISTREKAVRLQDIVHRDQHLLGEHTVRISPISTAHLNPSHLSFCLSPPHNTVLIPILFNNSNPTHIEYSIAPVGSKSRRQIIKLNSKDLRKTEALWKENVAKPAQHSDHDDDDEDEDPELDWSAPKQIKNSSPPVVKKSILTPQQQALYEAPLKRTQMYSHIHVNKPGIIQLESAVTGPHGEVRIIPGEVVVVECPTAQFDAKKTLNEKECSGASRELAIKARGVAPLKLKWHREINGKREQFQIDGIEGAPETVNLPVTEDITIPLTVSLTALGRHRYVIDSLTDAVGNVVEPSSSYSSSSGSGASRSVDVIRRSSITFPACGSGKSISMYKGSEPSLPLAFGQPVSGPSVGATDVVRSIKVRYEPPPGGAASTGGKPWTKDYPPKLAEGGKNITPLSVHQPGTYTIVGVQGEQCLGDVLSPESCKVVEVPPPTAEVDLKPIHECSGDVGIKATLIMHGTPPFTVFYSTKRNNENRPRPQHRMFQGARGEIVLQPESSGSYEYLFTHVSDANYDKVKLEGKELSIKQVVHPLAAADFVRSGGATGGTKRGGGGKETHTLSSCSGSDVSVDVDLRGTGPWTLEFQLVGPRGSQLISVPDLKQPRSQVSLPIPEEVDSDGGTFQIDLVSVVDATECKRTLNVPGIAVDVKRVKPTARFYSIDGPRQVTILEGETASLPLRLTGDGPWSLQYRRLTAEEGEKEVYHTKINNANGVLSVRQKGTYELTQVQDMYCIGTVADEASNFLLDWVPKPTVQFAPTAGSSARNESIIRPPVCSGMEDYAELRLTGRPPYQITYQYTADTNSHERIRDVVTINSVQDSARLQLRTSLAGHHQYQITQVGDGAYPVRQQNPSLSSSAVVPIVRGQFLEQDVLIRPTAEFKSSNRVSYCLNDPLTPRNAHSDDGTIVLKGQAPFTLGIAVRSVATNDIVRETVEVHSNEWKLNLPSYKLTSVGPTMVMIESVKDSSPCSQAELDTLKTSIWVDVAETAAIVPFDRREDFCEGEVISFQLEGSPPWTVRYSFNNKVTTAVSKTSKFSRVPVEPGIFKILSVAHQSNMCQTNVDGVQGNVRPVPIAKVSHGRVDASDLREGEQAKIVFELIGTPPFAFTYQRTQLASRGTKGAKVLETHTVSNVMTNDYSILSAQEGTWTVTFISDKYCRYPSSAPDAGVEEA